MKIGTRMNDYGTLVSLHRCGSCGSEFTVCPPVPDGQEWGGCQAEGCASYDKRRDADRLFDSEPWRIERGDADA
jgi:hypothetical protein